MKGENKLKLRKCDCKCGCVRDIWNKYYSLCIFCTLDGHKK